MKDKCVYFPEAGVGGGEVRKERGFRTEKTDLDGPKSDSWPHLGADAVAAFGSVGAVGLSSMRI